MANENPKGKLERKLENGNTNTLFELGFQKKLQKDNSLKEKIEEEKEKPLIELKTFLIKLDSENIIKNIENIRIISEKIDFIEKQLFKEIKIFFIQKNSQYEIENFDNIENTNEKISYFETYLTKDNRNNSNQKIYELKYCLNLLNKIQYNNSL